MATAYIVGLVENGEYGVAIAYSSMLIVVMIAVIGGFQLLVGERRLRRENRVATALAPSRLHPGRRKPHDDHRNRTGSVVFENVSKTFGAFTAIHDLSLTIEPGTLVTLLGPSGCGKTTTLRMLAGLEHPTSGRILIGGKDVTMLPANERDVSMVFQSYALFPHMTVLENVAYGLESSGRAASKDARRRREEGLAARRPRRLWASGCRPSCPAASSSASPLPARWCSSRRCCCSTSPCPTSMHACAGACARKSANCSSGSASPRSTSPTTRTRRSPSRTGSSS